MSEAYTYIMTWFFNLEVSFPWGLTNGQRYYVTVEACNAVNLCVHQSSDGFIPDVSPPVAGVIFVGDLNKHTSFLSHRYDA